MIHLTLLEAYIFPERDSCGKTFNIQLTRPRLLPDDSLVHDLHATFMGCQPVRTLIRPNHATVYSVNLQLFFFPSVDDGNRSPHSRRNSAARHRSPGSAASAQRRLENACGIQSPDAPPNPTRLKKGWQKPVKHRKVRPLGPCSDNLQYQVKCGYAKRFTGEKSDRVNQSLGSGRRRLNNTLHDEKVALPRRLTVCDHEGHC